MSVRITVPDMTTGNATSFLGSRVDASRTSGILLVGDLLAIAMFVAAGEIQHGRPATAGGLTFLEFAGGWLLAAVVVGAYATDAVSSPGRTVLIAGGGWLLGASLGVVIRVIVEPGFSVFPTFYLVALGVGGALIVGWRLLALVLVPELPA
jgi:hypothetical protein